MVATLGTAGEWVSKTAAARWLNVTPYTLGKLIERRALATRTLPGDRPKVSVADILRLIEQASETTLAGKKGSDS